MRGSRVFSTAPGGLSRFPQQGSWLADARASFFRARPLFATVFMVNMVFAISSMILEPTFRSWIICDQKHHSNASSLVVESGSKSSTAIFSGSATCGDKKLVVERAVRANGQNSAVQGALSVLALPILGAYGDRHGRRPVLVICVFGYGTWLLLVLASQGSYLILLVASIIRGITSAWFATFQAILGDLGGNRSMAFTVKLIVTQAGHSVGWLMGLCILRQQLLDYTGVWFSCVGLFLCSGLVFMRVQESLPARHENLNSMRFVDMFLEPVRLLWRDPFLLRWCVAKFVLTMGLSVVFLLRSFVLSTYDWQQWSYDAFLGVTGVVCALSTLSAPVLIRRWSAKLVVARCALVFAISLTCLALAPLGPVFCLVPLLIKAAAFGCGMTASNTLLSDRCVGNQGKAQASVLAVAHAAGSIGHLVYASLFDAKALGAKRFLPFCFSGLHLLDRVQVFARRAGGARRAGASRGQRRSHTVLE